MNWETIAKGNESITIPISNSLKLKLLTGSALSPHIYCGAFEWEEREWLLNELKPGDVFYDIGANVGYFTLLAAEICGKNGQVVSFEPVKETFASLSENVQLNPQLQNIQLLNYAVSDKEGDQNIYIPENGKDAWNSMAVKPDENHSVEVIRTTCPDLLFKNRQIQAPGVVKIDVQGWELHVIEGDEGNTPAVHPVLWVSLRIGSRSRKPWGKSRGLLNDLGTTVEYDAGTKISWTGWI